MANKLSPASTPPHSNLLASYWMKVNFHCFCSTFYFVPVTRDDRGQDDTALWSVAGDLAARTHTLDWVGHDKNKKELSNVSHSVRAPEELSVWWFQRQLREDFRLSSSLAHKIYPETALRNYQNSPSQWDHLSTCCSNKLTNAHCLLLIFSYLLWGQNILSFDDKNNISLRLRSSRTYF
jgi:hypothetical protein